MAWATVGEVKAITGKDFTPETIAIASSVIDTFTGADESMPDDAISPRDRSHLKKATAWECFFAVKPGFLEERENASNLSSDTQSIAREDRADTMLHPLARREILNLSWVGTRTVIVPPARPFDPRFEFLNERSDSVGRWDPL